MKKSLVHVTIKLDKKVVIYMLKFNFLRNNRGTSLVVMTFILTIALGMSAVVVDVARVIVEKQKLQNAVDAVALAAAVELPDIDKAVEIAEHYIEENGYTSSDISITFSDSNTKINIKGIKTIDYVFAKIFGFTSKTTECNASAVTDSIRAAFDYVLFSGSTTKDLIINGSNLYVDGSSHTNRNFLANGSKQTITGVCEAVNNITVNGSQMDIDNRIPHAPFVEMPDFSEQIKSQAEKTGTSYPSSKTYSGSYINVDQPIYVNGDLTVNGSHFRGKGCVLVTGNIVFNGSNLYDSTGDAVCFYSQNGNITINGSNAELNGIVYAPNGTITMNGSNQTIYGRVIGKNLTFNGSGLTVEGNPLDLKSIPGKGSKLVN